jgi:type I restriction enzyme S subunit
LTATTSGWFDPRHFKYTDESFPDDSPFWIAPGDIVIQRGNTSEYVGVPALYEGPPREFLYPDLMIRVRAHPDVSPRFLWYMLLSPQAREFLRSRATGSAGNMPKINQKILSEVPIPLPSPSRQAELVEQLDSAFSSVEQIDHRVASASSIAERISHASAARLLHGESLDSDSLFNGLSES